MSVLSTSPTPMSSAYPGAGDVGDVVRPAKLNVARGLLVLGREAVHHDRGAVRWIEPPNVHVGVGHGRHVVEAHTYPARRDRLDDNVNKVAVAGEQPPELVVAVGALEGVHNWW